MFGIDVWLSIKPKINSLISEILDCLYKFVMVVGKRNAGVGCSGVSFSMRRIDYSSSSAMFTAM